MFPAYRSGDIVAVKKITNYEVLLWGESYLIITNADANNMRTIKLLHQHSDNSKVILRSINPNFSGDTIIDKKDVIGLYIVKGKITKNML